ncbi:bromodomain-containing protein 8 isoform X3 [Periplaneta americana]|uniref:bromodomain-containing protein 8 isoform X3 n=1 Tax=Periplaneta americana TaxID=6978 RepID=UPI0037E718F0
MNSVQERLKLKRVPIDTWSTKEKLCLASAVLRSGDQNWMSVSRALRLFGEPGRPIDWFSQKSCALQYGNLLENVDTPKRKKRTDKSGSEHVETPGEAIVRNLTHERINELKKLLQEERAMYLKLKDEVAQIRAGQVDDKLGEMCQHVEEEQKQKERDAENHKRWLQERQEKKNELERAWKPPVTPASPHRKKLHRGLGGNRRNSSQSEPSSEADSAVDSPLSEPLNVDVIGDEAAEVPQETKPTVPTPTSPLLTSLLKSPSPAPSAQSSILHSAITSTHHRGGSNSPTIASLLHSSPGIPAPGAASVAPPPATVSSSLKNLVTSAIGAAGGEETPKLTSTSPAAGAPTLSMLLELPPSLPGKPLPELPVSSVAKPPHQHLPPSTNKAGEVCHPQHQEMRVRREVGTDEPVEVVAVEEHADVVTIPHLRDQVVGMEVVVGPQDVGTMKPPITASQKLLDEELEDVSQAIADVEKMEMEKQASKKEEVESKPEADTKEENIEVEEEKKKEAEEVSEDVKMLMDMPIVVEEATPEPQTIAEVVEVPAHGTASGDLDIIIVDSSTLGGQEEVPQDTECQVVEVVLDGKTSDGSKQGESSDDSVTLNTSEQLNDSKDSKEDVSADQEEACVVKEEDQESVVVKEDKQEVAADSDSAEVTVISSTVEEDDKDLSMDEGSRIEVVAIQMPSPKTEESSKEVVKEDKDEEKSEEKEEQTEVKEEGEMTTTEEKNKEDLVIKEEEPEKNDENKAPVEEAKESETSEDSSEQKVEIADDKKEVPVSEVESEVVEESTEEKVEDSVKKEKEAEPEADEKPGETSEAEKEATTTTEQVEEEVKQIKETVKKEPKKRITAEDRLDAIAEDIMSESYEAAEKASEATEEDDSRADSSEDEKKADEKSWVVAEQVEEVASTGGKTWKEEDEEEDEEEEKKEKGAGDELKQTPHKTTTVQKATVRADTPSTEDDKTNDAVEPPRGNRRRGAAATPVDSVPNSPAAPLTDEDREYRAWKKAIMLVYGRLATHKYASLFLRPITDDQAPGYSSIVHRPIDLLTIKKNIELGVTRTTAEFQRDVMLMFLNSIMYNKSSHFVHKMARQMQQEGMQHVQDFLTTQMLVQVVGEAPLRRETRTTEANKQRDFLGTPGSSSQDETDGPSTQSNKRKRAGDQDRGSAKKRKVATDE